MGKIKRGILGGFSGKVANIIGGSWKGIAYMRSLPLSVANPRTASQVAQRTSFSFAVSIAKVILALILKPFWDRFAQGMSGYNAFMSANIQHFHDWTTTVWADIVTSVGKMAATEIQGVTGGNGDNTFEFTFITDLADSFQQATDIVMTVVVNETQEYVAVSDTGETRAGGVTNIQLPTNLVTGDKLHVYMQFKRADGSIVSDSKYLIHNIA